MFTQNIIIASFCIDTFLCVFAHYMSFMWVIQFTTLFFYFKEQKRHTKMVCYKNFWEISEIQNNEGFSPNVGPLWIYDIPQMSLLHR